MNKLEALVWFATVMPAENEIGLPFLPEHVIPTKYFEGDAVSPLDREWVYSCIHLTGEGRCGNYDERPNLCRIFRAGIDQPCAMTYGPDQNLWEPM